MPPTPQQIDFEHRKRKLFEDLKNLNQAEQAHALSRHSTVDRELADAVWKLLHASRPDSDGILNTPLYERSAVVEEQPKAIGKYIVERQIGWGGMGNIYACRDRSNGTFVAVKIIRSDLQSQAARDHFKRERDILLCMNHPNICRILDAHVADQGAPFIVMEYIDGQRLDQYCAARRSTITDKLLLFSQILAGVDYLHSKNVVHRDLKPSNLMVTPRGNVRILDFGIAKLVDHEKGQTGHNRTTTKRPFMTIPYASPEQLSGTLSGRASDVFTLGLICYELLTGRLPSPPGANNPQGVLELRKHLPLAPSRVAPGLGISPSMDNLVFNATQFHPEGRYRSIRDFLSDLRRCLEGGTVPNRFSMGR